MALFGKAHEALEPLNLWIYVNLGALYPFKPWTLEP